MIQTPLATVARPALEPTTRGRFVDLFCGIGGFHYAATSLGLECVFASDIDGECRKAYHCNHGLQPRGDIAEVAGSDIPDHELLCAGFPCQPFSIIGQRKGFDDTRGTLFFEIARILTAKTPAMIVLENVKQLAGHDGGRTLVRIMKVLAEIGYHADWKVLNALDYGVPQKRERVLIVGFRDQTAMGEFTWPPGDVPMKPLADILERTPDPKHAASEAIRASRHDRHVSKFRPGIWHENKSGHISSHPWSCALRAGASYNYLLVDGQRRLSPREMLRLQGFPDSFAIVTSDSQTRKQAGNSVPVPMVASVIEEVLHAQESTQASRQPCRETRTA